MNKLLEIFNVNNYHELVMFIEKNPDNKDVIALKELLAKLEIDAGERND